jgi:hypothetical protein
MHIGGRAACIRVGAIMKLFNLGATVDAIVLEIDAPALDKVSIG